METDLDRLRKTLRKAQRVAALTGAGISAESGVPTFRGADGLWQNYQVTDLATPAAFARDPELVWKFYNWRRRLISKVKPNPAHYALVNLETHLPEFTLITQNVDGLHREAGSQNILELHGNLWEVACTQCGEVGRDTSAQLDPLPRCRSCRGLLRPRVVWFGEALDPAVLQQAVTASRASDVMLVIGTSSVVQPAASIALEAGSGGAFVAEINLEPTPLSGHVDVALYGKAGEVLPRLLEGWQ